MLFIEHAGWTGSAGSYSSWALEVLGKLATRNLIQALSDTNQHTRQTAAARLKAINWKPASGQEEISYLIAREDWQELIKVKDENVILAIVRIIEKQGEHIHNFEGDKFKQIVTPATLKLLEEAYAKNDREKITVIENALTIVDKPALLKWKQERLKENLPAIQKVGIYTAIGLVAAVIVAGISIACVKLFKLKKSSSITLKSVLLAFVLLLPLSGASITQAQVTPAPSAPIAAEIDLRTQNKKIEELIKKLSDRDENVRKSAVDELVKIGKPAVKPLIGQVSSWILNAEARSSAAEALGAIGDLEAIEPLITALHSWLFDVRKASMKALVKIGPPATPSLLKALKDTDEDASGYAAEILVEIRDRHAVTSLVEMLKDRDEKLRKHAAYALGGIGDKEAAPALIEALKDKDPDVWKAAARALGQIREKRVVPYMLEVLKNKDHDKYYTREIAIIVLGEIGDNGAIQPLVEEIRNENKYISEAAAEALAKIGEPAVLPLSEVLKDKNDKARELAIKTLGKIGDKRAVPYLIMVVKDEGDYIQGCAMEALGEIGDPRAIEPIILALKYDGWDRWAIDLYGAKALSKIGQPAVPALIEALKDKNDDLRHVAAEALGNIGDRRAVSPLIEMLNCRGWLSRAAVEALGAIGDKQAIQPLVDLLGRDDRELSEAAANAIYKISDKQDVMLLIKVLRYINSFARTDVEKTLVKIGQPAVLPLIEVLKCDDRFVCQSAIEVLGKIGDRQAVKPIIPALKNTEWTIRQASAISLGQIGDKEAIPALTEALKDKEEHVRESAAEALGNIGGKEAIMALVDVSEDEDKDVRKAVAEAIIKINAPAELLRELEEAYSARDREKIKVIEKALNEVDKEALLGWKRGRVDQDLPAIQRVTMYTALGLVVSVILGAIAYVLAKVFRLRKANKIIPIFLIAIALGLLTSASGCRRPSQEEFIQEQIALLKTNYDDGPNHIFARQEDAAREKGLKNLVEIGEPAVPALVGELKRAGSYYVTEAVVEIGKPAVPELIKAFEESHDSAKNVANALCEIADPRTVQVLIKILKGNYGYNTSKDAAKALVKIGKSTVPLLLEALMDESSREGYNVEVLKVLIDIKDARSVSSLLKISASMSDWDKDVKGPVVEAIVAMGRSAVPVLTEALKDSDKNIRENAAGILSRLKFMPETESDKIAYAIARHDWGRLVEIGSPAIPLLIKALKDQDSDIRQYAAETLGKIGDKEALPALNEALKDEKDEVGVSIAIALGRIGDKRAVPALIKALFEWSGVNHDYRHYISEALGRIGQPGVSALIELMHDTDYWRRQRAAISLGEIGDKQNIPILVEALSDSADEVRSSAAEALGKIGDKRAVPALLKAFNNKRFAADRANFIARESMAEALGKIGDRKAVPDLLGALNDDSIYVRYRSAEALYVMGDHSGFPVLVEVLRGDTYGYDMRCEVVDFLCKIGDERIVRALVDLIETQKDSRLSEYMVNGLSEISNRQAIPVLAEVSKDKSKVALCNAAALAICKIGDKQVIQDLLDRMDEYARVYDMRVCQAIIRNMGKAGENKLVPYLLEHLDSTDVVETLGKIGDPRAVEPLFRRGGEDKARDRAIVKIGAGAVEFLAEVLVNKTGDYNEKDAYRAAMLLEKIPDIRAIDPLVGALNSSYYVQLSVVKALKAIAGSTEDVPALLKLLKANLPEPHAYTSSSDYSAEVDRMRSLAAAKLIAVAKKTTDELLLRQLLDADDPDIRNAARDCLKEMLNVPALLKELEGAYIRQDREKISAVEILLSEVDPQTLLDWKRERFEKELPTIRKVGVYAAIGLVVSAILGAVVYVLAKAFGLRKSNKTINLLIFALVLLSPLAFTQPTFAQAPQQQPQAVTQDAPQEEINKLVGALKDDVWIVRYEAAKALRELRWVPKSEEEEILYLIAYGGFDVKLKNAVKIGKPAAPALIGVLKLNFEGDIRAKVAEALGEIRDPLAVPALIESLKDEFWLVRCRAAAALGKICDSRALYPLIEKLHDESRHVREHATEALGMIGLPEAVEPLAGELNDEDQEIRNAAALALGMIGTPEVVPPLMEALRGRDTSIHSSAARALGYCHDPRATPLLIAKLDDGARYTYQSVVEALGEIGSPEAIPPLIKLLDDWEYANNASGALIKIGQPAVPAVVNLLKDKDRGIRRRAVHILEEIADPGTISVLIKAAGEDIGMRSDILKIVDSIKATNKTKVPKLLGELDKAYADNNREKIIGLETVLAEVDSRALLDWKKARLEKELPTIRKVGVYAAIGLAASAILGAIVYVLAKVFRLRRSNKTINFIILALMLLAPVGCSAKQQVEVPLTAAQVTQQVVPETQEKEIRKVIDRVKLGSSLADYAVKDLAEIGSPAITVLIRVLKDNDKLTRRAAAYALGKLDVKISAPYLIEALKDKDTYVQHSAIKALAEIDDRQAVQPLIDILLNGDDSFCRASAAEALGKLGDRSAIPALTQAVKFGNSWVCEHASAALGKIGGSEAVRPLIEILNNERLSIYLLESVIKSLGEIHDSQATPVLAQVLSNDAVGGDSNFELHELAIKSLGSIGDKGALQILTEALRNRWHADSAAAALGRVGDPQAVQPLIEALMDKENWVLRKRAAFALGELRDVRATIPLSGLLNDENYEVRNAAIEALGQIGDPRATHELVKALKDSESRKTPNRIEEAISKIDIAPTLLRDLEEAHAVHDREKIFEIESVLLRFDPASLNKWKEGRIKDKLPEIARIAKYAGVVMVLFTILGGVIYAALKAARRHKNIASIVFIVAAASAAFYLGGAGSFAAGGESAGAVLAAIPFIGMPKDGTGVDAVIAEEMTKLHSAMAGDARKKVIGKDLREQYEFTRRDRRKWAQFINKYSDEFGVTKAFIKGAKYIYGDRMQNAEDEKIFLQHLKACNLQALAERDAREVDLEELLDNKRIEYFTQAFGNNPAVLYQFCVRTEDPAKQDIIKEVAGLLSGSDVTSQVKGIVTWAALPDDIAEFLVMHGLQFDDHRLIEAVVRVAGAKSFRQFQGQLLRFSRNGNESLAVSSLEALIEMGAADAAEEIFKDLSGRQSNRMLVARIRAVALLKHGKAAGQLVGAVKKFLGRSVSQEVRSAALDAITQLGCRDRAIDELNLMRPTLKPDGVSDLDDMIKMLKASPGMKVRPLPYAGDAQVSRLSNELVSMKRIIAKGFAAAMEENEEPYDDYSDRPDFFYRNGKSLQFIDTKTSINGRKEGKESVPDERSTRIVPILRTVQDLEKIAQAVELQDPLLLVGETGVGKTTLIRYLARLSKNNVRRFNLNGQTDKLEFIGGYKPEAYSITRDEAYDMAEVLLADESSEAVSALMNAVKKIAGQDMQYDAARKFIRRAFDGRHNTTIMALAEAVANKTFEFKWHYGVLVEAMRSGHWIILDEINLAEPEIIERIRYLLDAHPHLELSEYSGERWIDSRDYDEMVKKYVTKHGRAGSSEGGLIAEAVKDLTGRGIHRIDPNFRLFATMNPLEYEARKQLSPALMNKFRIKWIKELEPGDIAGILRARYDLGDDVISKLITLYVGLTNKEMSGNSGKLGRNEGISYYYTIRHLFRLAERIERRVKECAEGGVAPGMDTIIGKNAWEVYGDGLRSEEDRAIFKEMLDKVVSVPARQEEIKVGFDNTRKNILIGDVALPVNSAGGPLVPGPDSKLLPVGKTATLLEKIARSVLMDEKTLLVGPTGSAKTSLIRYLAHLTRNEFIRVNLDAQADTSDLIGKPVPKEGSKGEIVWEDGILLRAMEKGQWILLDEFNLAEPDILERINSILDDDGSLVVTENNNERWVPCHIYDRLAAEGRDMSGIRRIHENFRLFAAMNPERYAGRNKLSRAMMNKLAEKWVSGDMDDLSVKMIAKFYLTDSTLMEEPPVKESAQQIADIISGVYISVRSMLEKNELGRGKISGANAGEYNFSLRDLKALAKFVRGLSGALGANRAVIEGSLYIFRDRLEGIEDKGKFKDDVLGKIDQSVIGGAAVDIEKLDVLEEEGRSAAELITQPRVGAVAGPTPAQIQLAELVEKFDALTMGFPAELNSEEGLGAIRKMLLTAGREADGVRGFALLPADTAILLIDEALESVDPEIVRAACEVIGRLGLRDYNDKLFILLTDSDMKTRVVSALVLEKLKVSFSPGIGGRPAELPYFPTINKLLGKNEAGELDYLGREGTIVRISTAYLFSIPLISVALYFLPYGWTSYIYFFGAMITIGIAAGIAMFLSYTVIFYPLYKLVNNRFKTLPLRVEDFFELFKPLDGKHIIRLPFASNTQGPFITSTTGNIIAGIGAVSTSAICGFIAYGAYISGLSTVLGWSGLIVFIGSSFLGSLALGYGISVILELCAVVLGESIFHPFIYLFKSLFPAVGHENFEKEMPYSDETIKLFEKYREQQKSAASFNRSISGDRDGAQDMASMLRDNKVSIEKERVVIDDITLPVKQGPPDVFVPDREDAKLINTVSTIRNMKKVAISLVLNEPVLLVGESGVGKTSIVRYLASITNRGFRRFNLNGQTEKTELIGGYRPDGDGNFKWVDGMLMHAMRDGHILVLDEINLAESQVLERINSLLDDDRHLTIPERNNTYWLDAGKYDLKLKEMMEKENLDAAKAGEMLAGQNIFRINENFRLVATMNPVEYAGRNILSPALMNRFKVKWIDEPYSLERQAIFNELFKDADGAPMLGWGVLDRIDWFHSRLKDFSMARRIGQDERDPYYYSIRDLLKLGGRIRAKIDKAEAATKKKLTPTERRAIVVREVVSVYADRIRSEEDRENVLGRINEVFDGTNEPLNYEIRTIGQGAVKIGDTVIRKRDGRGPYVPGASARLFETETTNKYLAKIAEMIEMKEMPLLVGPTGSAKTSLVRYLAYLTGNNFVRVNLDAQTDTSEIIGSYVPVENEEGKFEWRDGLLVTALKKGYWILLDELNLADPEILERINSLLDDEGCLVITEHENEKIMSPREYRGKIEEYIRRNGNKAEKSMDELMREAKAALEKEGIYGVDPNFRLFTAMNPERYAGRNRLSLAMRNKLSEIWISGEMSDAEYEKIIGGYLADNPEKKNMVKAMVKLHQGMQYVIEYLEGGTIDKYQFSMRDIKAWAGYINRYGKRLGWTEAFAKGALYFYYERMTTKGDKDKFMEWFEDVIGKASYQQASKCAKALLGRRISDEQKKAIVAGGRVPILDIPLETNKSPKEKELVPKLETARLVHTASTVKDLEKIAQAADLNDPLLLVGETGAGKTSLVRYLAYLTNNSFQRLNLSGQTEKMDFIGGYYPEENGRFVWRDGALINAMRNGQWLVIDEINLAPSQVIERLNSLLDDDGFLVVTEHRAEKYVRKPEYDKRLSAYVAEIKGQDACSDQEALARAKQRLDDESIYPIDPNFRIFATMNPSEYAGR
ncbi:MAG: HEAT repeat domain-containing protein, partial [Candidatus Omnitrophica bacterium]|nr:HEAT repeat domain-containing protein [Candidatus Omnitrophota bacterium]